MSYSEQADAKLHLLSGVLKTLTSIFGGGSEGIKRCINNPGPPICVEARKTSQTGGQDVSGSQRQNTASVIRPRE